MKYMFLGGFRELGKDFPLAYSVLCDYIIDIEKCKDYCYVLDMKDFTIEFVPFGEVLQLVRDRGLEEFDKDRRSWGFEEYVSLAKSCMIEVDYDVVNSAYAKRFEPINSLDGIEKNILGYYIRKWSSLDGIKYEVSGRDDSLVYLKDATLASRMYCSLDTQMIRKSNALCWQIADMLNPNLHLVGEGLLNGVFHIQYGIEDSWHSGDSLSLDFIVGNDSIKHMSYWWSPVQRLPYNQRVFFDLDVKNNNDIMKGIAKWKLSGKSFTELSVE